MQLYEKSAAELHKMLRSRQCSAAEVLKSYEERIEKVEPLVGAYITLALEEARADAKRADELFAGGGELPDMLGIPIGIKDNIVTKNIKTTCASKMLHSFMPPYSAGVMDRLSAAGAVVLGKLNMDEFAMGSSTESSYFKTTKNPHDLGRVPGGSSGGSAAAVAACLAAVALGSDTGGSIRQPSAYCGVVGLKPTYGAVSRYGLVAFASSLDQIGPIGRTADDVALLFDSIAGKDERDSTSININHHKTFGNISGGVAGLRIGIPKEYFGEGVDKSVYECVMARANELEGEGAIVSEISLPNTKYALSAYYVISSAEASSNLARYDGVKYGYRAEDVKTLDDLYLKSRSEGFGDEVKRRIMLGTFVLSSGYFDAYYKKAKYFQQSLREEFNSAFKGCDVILTPTAPDTAFKFGEHSSDPLVMYASDVCTVSVNIAGLPAVSVPAGLTPEGLPVGVQLIGNRFSERTLLSVAKTLETISGGFPAAKL